MNGFLQVLGSLRNVFIYVSMCISIPSFLLYCSECAVITGHRKLHNSFNWLFIARAIPNLLNFISSLFGYRLPIIFGDLLLPLYQLLPYWFLRFYWFIFYFCYYADNLATVFIHINRLMAVLVPFKYEQFWRKFLPFSLAIIYGVPLYFSYRFYTMGIQLLVTPNDPFSNTTTFGIYENGTTYCADNDKLAIPSTLIFLLVCTCINVITLILYKWRIQPSVPNQANNANNNQASQKIERNLMIYAMGTFFGHAIFGLLMLSSLLKFDDDEFISFEAIFATYPIISDFGTVWLPSWFLIWANMAFRDQWVTDLVPRRVIKCWRNGKPAAAKTNVINVQPPLLLQINMAFEEGNLLTICELKKELLSSWMERESTIQSIRSPSCASETTNSITISLLSNFAYWMPNWENINGGEWRRSFS